ncbi:hypothetical protein [Nocardioides bruguierae]|uniref:hypothetical protein n=1 Tax=Nocardioides bruguierae TaxID=2945102 RepID=UPI0020209D1B|nr:hypothetical protein [Nocardioides bruguierae]MCL8023848.1 hypothetical protein [Nocardioides bruguierae]
MPLERSRSVVTLVTRNITVNGKIASSAGPTPSKESPGTSENTHHSSDINAVGSTSSMATVRRSRRSCASTRSATASVTGSETNRLIAHLPRG